MYGANEIAIDGDSQKDVRYIRITDIDDHGNLQNEDWKTAKKVDEKYTLYRNDLLFARSGATAGKAFIHKREHGEAIFAGYLIRFRLDETRINPFFVFYYTLLNRYRLWIRIIQRPSGQPNINSREFKAFEIPFPPPNIQNHIVTIMKSAYAQKEQKEQEADALLDSIDDYVLRELGIEMPEVEEKKCFVVYAGEIEGRFDPLYMQNISHIRNLKTPYPLTPLRQLLIEKPQYGANERAVDGNPETDVRYIRITDIDDYGNLLDDWKTAEVIYSKYLLEESDVLFARSGSVGRAFVYKSDLGRAIFAGYLIRFKFDLAKINPSFVLYYSFTKIYKLWLQSIQRAAVQPNINSKEFQSLEIPLPPLAVQNRIVEEVSKRLDRVEELKQEADTIVEQAKERVESILLR